MTTAIETVTCRYCRIEFQAVRIDGQLQCTDGAGLICCAGCYDDTTGYGREQN